MFVAAIPHLVAVSQRFLSHLVHHPQSRHIHDRPSSDTCGSARASTLPLPLNLPHALSVSRSDADPSHRLPGASPFDSGTRASPSPSPHEPSTLIPLELHPVRPNGHFIITPMTLPCSVAHGHYTPYNVPCSLFLMHDDTFSSLNSTASTSTHTFSSRGPHDTLAPHPAIYIGAKTCKGSIAERWIG